MDILTGIEITTNLVGAVHVMGATEMAVDVVVDVVVVQEVLSPERHRMWLKYWTWW